MISFIQNMIWNSVSGFVEAGTRTVGGFAGDALIKAGDAIEGSGRSVGNGIERKATGYGSTISGQTYKPSAKALPSTARKPVMKRSNSTPANSKPGSTTMGASKYPGAGAGVAKSAVGGVTGGAKNTIGGVGGGVKSTVGGVTGGAKGAVGGVTGGVVGGASKGVGGVVGNASKGVGGVVGNASRGLGGAQKSANGLTGGAQKALGSTASTANKQLPKPFPNSVPYSSSVPGNKSANGLPKPYNDTPAYPAQKKTAVRSGAPKPFTPPPAKSSGPVGGASAKSPYPGTNTLPGQASRTPVKKYKPLERVAPPAEPGKAQFF